ncbi:proteasome activator complex subunit 3 [Reticulomyxa filosa]|uniref:Proteasome activator complex subunit 3 n=1 Tax=Reticulomyxa filosa TaxID=46433 RepID=X6N296_RETFI|nr:proteasome activator complex subunit 3 [Reticulomyxa filosa]|eukprot:ETO20033.1 proteasome activator complex subunit 3 [Reticulomyxa filosa]
MTSLSSSSTVSTLLNQNFESKEQLSFDDFKKLATKEQKQKWSDIKADLEELKKFSQNKADDLINVLIPEKLKKMGQLVSRISDELKKEKACPIEIQVDEKDSNTNNGGGSQAKRKKKDGKRGDVKTTTKKEKYTEEEKIRMRSDNGCNERLMSIIDEMNSEVNDVLIIASDMRLSISLCVPEMQEGNNFGVGVQEEVLKVISLMENNAQKFNSVLSSYHVERGRLISDICKYPQILNYKHALTLFDLQQYTVLKCMCNDLKIHYCCLYNIYTKNIDKLKQPRNTGSKFFIY